jgi:hypothetical protein
LIVEFIRDHAGHREPGGLRWGVEPICAVLTEHGLKIAPWRTVDAVEYATAEYVEWFNHRRLYEHCGDIPPVDLENAYYAHHRAQPAAAISNQ